MTKRKRHERDPYAGVLSTEDTCALFEHVVEWTKKLAGHVARLTLDGELNLLQRERVLFISRANSGLQQLFVDEIARMRGGETPEEKAS